MINLYQLGSALFRGVIKNETPDVVSRFTKGEILQGTVVKSLGAEGALVRIKGFTLVAATSRSLVAGQNILVKVDQLKPQFVLSLLLNDTPSQEKTAALLRLYLPSALPIGSVVENLKALLASLPKGALQGSDLEAVLARLEQAIKNPGEKGENLFKLLGLSHEAELAQGKPTANLKSALLIVRQNLEAMMEKDPAAFKSLHKAVSDALQNIELRQLVNDAEKPDAKSWQFPYWNGEKMATGHLFVGRDGGGMGKDGKSGDVTRISMFLEMSSIGPVRAEVVAGAGRVEGSVYVESDDAVRWMDEELPSLVAELKDDGFSSSIQIKRGEREFLLKKPTESIPLPVKGLLNVRA